MSMTLMVLSRDSGLDRLFTRRRFSFPTLCLDRTWTESECDYIGRYSCVGHVIDDSIIVIENIYRKFRQYPDEDRTALTISGTKEMMTPIITSTLTSIFVFLPFCLFTGKTDIGQFMMPVGMCPGKRFPSLHWDRGCCPPMREHIVMCCCSLVGVIPKAISVSSNIYINPILTCLNKVILYCIPDGFVTVRQRLFSLFSD